VEQARACITQESNADEALTGIGAFGEDVKLLGQLFTLGTVLVGFTRYARHELSGHSRDIYKGEYAAEQGDKLRFDYFNGHIVDEAFQSNL